MQPHVPRRLPGFVNAHSHAFQRRAARARSRAATSGPGASRCWTRPAGLDAGRRPCELRRASTARCGRPATPPSASSTTSASPRRRRPPRRPRRPASSSSSSMSPTAAAASTASGRTRRPTTSSQVEAPARGRRSASASPPTPSAPARATGSRRSGATPTREGLVLHVHADEQPREIEECLAEHGLRPIELLAETGCLGPRTTIVHGDARRRRASSTSSPTHGARVCVCPTTEANLGDGFPPARADLLERGIALCIGSDSNVRIDPLEELRELEGIARRQALRRNVIPPEELLAIGSLGGRRRARARRRGRASRSTSATARCCGVEPPGTSRPRSCSAAAPTSSRRS